MSIDVTEKFDKYVKHKKRGKLHTLSCSLGLWSVEGRDEDRVMREAFSYFVQYYGDGEYDDT